MAKTSWPRVNEDTTDAQYSELFDSIIGSGVRGSADLAVSATSSGMTVRVAAGFATVAGSAFLSTAVETLTVAANTATSTRTDLVILRRSFTAATGETVTLTIKQGTPGSSAPSLAQDVRSTYEIALAEVRVGPSATAITSAAVSDLRPLMPSRMGVWGTSTRPALRAGLIGLNTSTGRWEHSGDGSAWRDLLSWTDIPGKPATFPPSAHKHAIDGDTTGTLPLARGGTGATSAVAALQALGIYVQSTAPAHANGRVWIKR